MSQIDEDSSSRSFVKNRQRTTNMYVNSGGFVNNNNN